MPAVFEMSVCCPLCLLGAVIRPHYLPEISKEDEQSRFSENAASLSESGAVLNSFDKNEQALKDLGACSRIVEETRYEHAPDKACR